MIAKIRNQTLDSFAGLGVVTHDTLAEYEALSQEEKMDGNVHLVLEEEPIDANIVEYTDDKTVKEALDSISELEGNADISTIGGGTITGAIRAINADLTAKTWGTPISITTTEYITTRDGYLILNSSTLTTGKMGAIVYDSTHTGKIVIDVAITDRYQYASVFVRKGMGVSITNDTSSGVVAQFNTLLPQ